MFTSTGIESLTGSVLIVAELSANHGHSLKTALETVKAAKDAGADAIKLQTYTPDTITIDCDNEYFQIRQGTIWDGTTLFRLYKEAYMPWEWHEAIRDEALKQGLGFFSTPFDFTAVDFLEDLGVPLYKIASFEINDLPLIRYAAEKKKPMILSTGIATIGEIAEAVETCRKAGNGNITLLKCPSAYPAPPEKANLATIPNMRDTFGVKVGLSDHTEGLAVAVSAVALGATIIEKHFILDRGIGGPDSSFSMEPEEFSHMVHAIRTAEKAIGTVSYNYDTDSIQGRNFARSLFAVEDIQPGETFTKKNVKSIRPGYGLPPKLIDEICGKRARMAIKRGTPLKLNMIR